MRSLESEAPKWLPWAQIAWVILVSASLLMFVVGAAVTYDQIRQVCTAAADWCAQNAYATPANVAQLAARGLSLGTYALLRVGFLVVSAFIPVILGLLIFVRRRREPIALLVSFFLITWITVGGVGTASSTYPIFHWPFEILDWISTGLVMPLFFGLFPNGRMVPRWYWGIVAYFGLGYLGQATLALVDINSPLGSFWSWSGWLSVLLGGVASQIYRYRRASTLVERQQTRWVLFGLGAFPMFLLSMLVYVAITGDSTIATPDEPDFLRRFAFLTLSSLAFQMIFVSIGIAVLRSKLFDIDLIIRKALIYTFLTALLALLYFGAVVLLQSLFESFSAQQSPLAIVISTLASAALFSPLRRRVQAFIDRRFFRQKYDAQQVLAHFAQTARDELSLEALTKELTDAVRQAVQPESVGLWLKPDQRPPAAAVERT